MASNHSERRRHYTGGGVALILAIAILDYLTRFEGSVAVLYIIPISIITWYSGRWWGNVAALSSALLWLVVDVASPTIFANLYTPYLNSLVRLGMFAVVVEVLSRLHDARQRQDDLSQFVVHDLRSPLTNIMAGLQLLAESETLDPSDRAVIDNGIISTKRMMTLINSILDLGRLESGKLEPDHQAYLLRDVVSSASQQVTSMAARLAVQVQVDVPADIVVLVDRELLVRVLVNLFSNAIKYSPMEGRITVTAQAASPTMIRVGVHDQGPGIPAAYATKIFGKYTQVETRRAGLGVGSGLGLTFCHVAVEAMGGRIWVESEPQQGTTVAFTVPCAAR